MNDCRGGKGLQEECMAGIRQNLKQNQVFSHGEDLPSHLRCCYSNRKETHADSWIDKAYRQLIEPDPLPETKSKLL